MIKVVMKQENFRKLEEKMGFPIKIIQVDNGYEFVNDREKTNKKGYFEMNC